MRFSAGFAMLAIVSTAWAQDELAGQNFDSGNDYGQRVEQVSGGNPGLQGETDPARKNDEVPNPFARPERSQMMDMMGAMGGMEGEMEEMGLEGPGMVMGMGMGGMEMGGMEGYAASSPEQLFGEGLQRAIRALRLANNDQTKETLRRHIRTAFEERYERMIATRKKDIARLKRSVAKLEAEMQRREAAKDRVVQLQLQSVQLAAEGILEPNELLPSSGSRQRGAADDLFGN